MNKTGKSKEQFVHRVNQQMYDTQPSNDLDRATNDTDRWLIGVKGRTTGSLHCDIWQGTAAELSESNYVAVYPTAGWWKTMNSLKKYNSRVRYSLVVTLSTPNVEAKLYTAITNVIGIPIVV